MFKKCRNILRNEKGLTLIELLAVVVILGIIAAIAIPSIGSLIDKSKTDAIIADGQQVMSSARLAIVSEPETFSGKSTISFTELDKYMEKIDENKYENIVVDVAGGKVTGAKITLKGEETASIELDANGKKK